MTLILDSGGVRALAGRRAQLAELRRRGQWPAQVPAVVLAETLTGDARRDYLANRLLAACQIRDVTAEHGWEAGRLRTATRRAAKISAVDAVLVAFADTRPDPVILTSDPRDISALAQHTRRTMVVAGA